MIHVTLSHDMVIQRYHHANSVLRYRPSYLEVCDDIVGRDHTIRALDHIKVQVHSDIKIKCRYRSYQDLVIAVAAHGFESVS